MDPEVSTSDYGEIEELIGSEDSPVGIDAKIRMLVVGLALVAAASLSGAFGFTSAVLSADDAQAGATIAASAGICPCGDGGPCCGFCPPARNGN